MAGDAAHSIGTENPRRFVVLEHSDSAGTHFDLMIDLGLALATWKCDCPPEEAMTGPLDCRRIDDHRRIYLDYEGPISGDRGHVRRYDHGTCFCDDPTQNDWFIRFCGQQLMGRYVITSRKPELNAYSIERIGD